VNLVGSFDDLSVVIPAFCEEGGITAALEQLRARLPGAEIIVVDDASTDQTALRATGHPDILVLQHPFNQGYGSSLVSGMLSATRDYVAWFDPDNEHRAVDLASMVHMIRSERLAAVIGQRKSPSVTLLRAVGKFAIRLIAKIFKINAGSDLNCGLRVFRRDVIVRYLPILPDRFSASLTTTILMLERGYPIKFYSIETGPRIGQSKLQIWDGFEALYKVLQLIMLFAPLRIFVPIGTLLDVIGFAYGITITFRDREGFPVAAMIFVILGALLIALGLIADQISQMRLSGFRGTSYAKKYAGSAAPPTLDSGD
jgi:glycosyltransferase involved in cell wall biosynthesis